MRDYLEPPVGYLVRVASAPADHAVLSQTGRAEAEAAGNFLSYEQIGKIAVAQTSAAIDTARIILNLAYSAKMQPEIVYGLRPDEAEDEALTSKGLLTVLSYLAQPQMGLPNVCIVYPHTMRAVCEKFRPGHYDQIVAPGGIVAIYQDGNEYEVEPRLAGLLEVSQC